MGSRIGLFLLIASVAICACGDERDREFVDRKPVACFTIDVLHLSMSCYWDVRLEFDASCSTDDNTPFIGLDARWDYDNDGVWDSGFEPAHLKPTYIPGVIFDPIWTARCQVRDRIGQVSERIESFDLGDIPVAPDIIAERLYVTTDEGTCCDADTVRAGQRFDLSFRETCWGELNDVRHTVQYYLDDLLIRENVHSCSFWLCEGGGISDLTIDRSGQYTLTVILDAHDEVSETDEGNNSCSRILTVISELSETPVTGYQRADR